MALRVISGEAKGRAIKVAKGAQVRPTSNIVKNALFSIIGGDVANARVLDLYAGTGALGIEALSRGAQWADFVEVDQRQCVHIRASLRELGLEEKSRVYNSKVEHCFNLLSGRYSLIFIDAPYEGVDLDGVMSSLASSSLVEAGSLVVLEHVKHVNPGTSYGALELGGRRRYGETCLSIYRYGGR